MKQALTLFVLLLVFAGLGYWSYRNFFPEKPPGPVALADCKTGMVACPNACLKPDAPGWHARHVDGHPDTDLWMTYVNPRGDQLAYNQHHVGHMIALVNGTWTDTGVCPVCRGTTRVCR